MRYYISDQHFFHNNMNTSMDNRGFEDLESMHRYMIDKWNSKVRRGDDVVILGDFSIGKGEETNEILAQLNGNKFLIIGNHDKYLEDRKFDRGLFKWIKDYMEVSDNKRKVILSHYPIICYNGQYRMNEAKPKTYMLYGHVHNSYDEILVNDYVRETRLRTREIKGSDEPVNIPCQMINCFCMFSDYTPLSLDEWIELDNKRRSKMNDN